MLCPEKIKQGYRDEKRFHTILTEQICANGYCLNKLFTTQKQYANFYQWFILYLESLIENKRIARDHKSWHLEKINREDNLVFKSLKLQKFFHIFVNEFYSTLNCQKAFLFWRCNSSDQYTKLSKTHLPLYKVLRAKTLCFLWLLLDFVKA